MLRFFRIRLKKEYDENLDVKIDIENRAILILDLNSIQNILSFLTIKEIANSANINKDFHNAAYTVKLTTNHLKDYVLAWYNARQGNPSLTDNPFITNPQKFSMDFIAKTEILLKKLISLGKIKEIDSSYNLYINIFKGFPGSQQQEVEREFLANTTPDSRELFKCFIILTSVPLVLGGIHLLFNPNLIGIPLILFGMIAPCCIMKVSHDCYICCAKNLNNHKLDNYNNSFSQPLIEEEKLEDFLIALSKFRKSGNDASEELERIAALSP